ncbi:MAG: TldD/PmbA family protein [Oscillospiraceae bacterium]|nr:TldD/PmbA family protein [Oscillospiraceae bacterium]
MIMDFKEFAKKLLDKALEKGFSNAEIYMSDSMSLSISTLDGEIEKFQNSASRGISFRGTYKNKIGYSYSELLDSEVIDVIVTEAMQNSEILEEAEQDKLFADYKDEKYTEIAGFNRELQSIPTEERIKSALLMEKSAKDADNMIKAVDYNSVSYSEHTVAIINTYGLDLKYTDNGANGYSYARAVKDGETKTGGEFWYGLDWNEFDPEKIGKDAAEMAVSKFDAKSIKSGQYKTVMKNTAFADLLDTFSSVFLANKAQKGLSLLAGKLNEKIAADIFTLRDDPIYSTQPHIQNSCPFDAEGVATFNKAVIENGVFKTFLHNLKTAAKDGVKSTGNASKSGYKSPVEVAPKNLYVAPGDITFDELIEKAGDGLYVTDVAGLHSGANEVSGDFSLLAEGFVIEDGKISKPVEQITVAGNFFDVLKDIEAVANDLRFSSVGSPAVYIKKLDVAGGEQ